MLVTMKFTPRLVQRPYGPRFKRTAALAVIVAAFACGASGCHFLFGYSSSEPLLLPSTPKPLAALNTPFNDFNAAAPDTAGGDLVFSSDRGSRGRHFDLWGASLHFEEDKVSVISVQPVSTHAMSPADELGPTRHRGLLVVSSDRPGGAGGMDLYKWTEDPGTVTRIGGKVEPLPPSMPTPLAGVNTPAYEGYWATTADAGFAMFASDRGGHKLDAYRLIPPLGATNPDKPASITRDEVLSTQYDETAFFMFDDQGKRYLFFASNRPGGRGDYDLYCSRHQDGSWLPPKPLSYANSPAKDFRPIVISGYFKDVLLFSSDRPGGQGGIDLYYVALNNPCQPASD